MYAVVVFLSRVLSVESFPFIGFPLATLFLRKVRVINFILSSSTLKSTFFPGHSKSQIFFSALSIVRRMVIILVKHYLSEPDGPFILLRCTQMLK